jgi:hypothetical protein
MTEPIKITVEIDPKAVREDEARAYEAAIEQFAHQWRLTMLAGMVRS